MRSKRRPGTAAGERLVVIGEGLAAGAGDFALSEESQAHSFVVQAARQMSVPFVIPYLQAPGILGAPGLAHPPVVLPNLMHTTVVDEYPLQRRHQNLAIPGYEVTDCLHRRPTPPLVHRDDPRQTVANLVLGLPSLTNECEAERPTQLEYAVSSAPSLAIVALGYAEALRTMLGEGNTLPSRWADDYAAVTHSLADTGAWLVLATVPDPTDTAACMTLDAAARVLCMAVSELASEYRLDAHHDCLTVRGVMAIASHLMGDAAGLLDESMIVRGRRAAEVNSVVDRMNEAIIDIAQHHGAAVLPLADLFARIRTDGVDVRGRRLTADLLGGLFTLNGCYPGATGHAVVANKLLAVINDLTGAGFPEVDVNAVAAMDATANCEFPRGGVRRLTAHHAPASRADDEVPARRSRPQRSGPLRLPETLEMTLPLCPRTSYHGDAIRVVDCADEREARFGSAANVIFGGPVLFDSHLSGILHLRFSPPERGRARFTVEFDALTGEDGVLSAPMFFRWPVKGCRVVPEPGVIAGGTVDLETGESNDVSFSVRYLNSALQALVSVNPGFPDQPIVFPGPYGSGWAKFDERDDGLLDFTFYGSTFLPLGPALGGRRVRWALPFTGTAGTFASIPARGLAMHPHLHLSTRPLGKDHDAEEASLAPAHADAPVDLPANSLCELTLCTRRSSFGDRFTLNSPELGGQATGRSHLLGRLLLQTGERFGDAMPVVVSLLGPGGLLGQSPPSPLAAVFPGRLSPGPVGHDEFLRFPTRNYFLDGVTLLDDPFDLSVGAVDLRTGRFINQLLHRGFIGQDLFFSLIRIEPRTPQSSFLFRGNAAIAGGKESPTLRFRTIVRVPYPAGFLFPAPDLTTAITVGENSVLDPYLWVRAVQDACSWHPLVAERREVQASTGERFSYRLEVRTDTDAPVEFEYSNHSQNAVFQLETTSWLGCSTPPGAHGQVTTIVTFSGFGRWSKDPTRRAHQVAAQVAIGGDEYVSIQIDSGLVSNVNTKPAEEVAALP
jgi:hypothetical protein